MEAQEGVTRARLLPLYAAGFITAFGAHGIAASLGGFTGPPLRCSRSESCSRSTTGRRCCSSRCSGRWPTGSAPARCCWAGWSPSRSPPRGSCSPVRARRCGGGPAGAGRRGGRVLPGCRGTGRPADPEDRAGQGVRRLRRVEGRGLHPRPPARWPAHRPRRSPRCCSSPSACSPRWSRSGPRSRCPGWRRCPVAARPCSTCSAGSPTGFPGAHARPWRPRPPRCRSGSGSCPCGGAVAGLGPVATGLGCRCSPRRRVRPALGGPGAGLGGSPAAPGWRAGC